MQDLTCLTIFLSVGLNIVDFFGKRNVVTGLKYTRVRCNFIASNLLIKNFQQRMSFHRGCVSHYNSVKEIEASIDITTVHTKCSEIHILTPQKI